MNRIQDTLIIIQASNVQESISGRLFLSIKEGMGALEFLVRRLKNAGFLNVAISTSDEAEDDQINSFANREGIPIGRGEFYNIPDRLLYLAHEKKVENFVRINATSPLVDIDKMIGLIIAHTEGEYEYSFNEHRKGVVWGMGCDIFSVLLLERLASQNLKINQMETVGQYIRQNRDIYNVYEFTFEGVRPNYKVSLDSIKDYEVVRELAENLNEYNMEIITSYLDAHRLVAGYNQETPLRENGIEKLFFSPEKVRNILSRRLPDMQYPISVELTLTNKCNLSCSYCSDLELRKRQGVNEQLDIETLKILFDDLSTGGTQGIVFEGGGEPTLYSDFTEAVTYAKSVGLAVGLITNGTRKLQEDLIEQFEWIRVSLDASTSIEYKYLKGVDLFEQVIGNMSEYVKHCNTVGVGYVVTKNNVSQIEPLVIRLKEIGVSYLQCRPVVDSQDLYPTDVDLSYLKYYENRDFLIDIGGMKENSEKGNNGLPCYAHSITSIISGDGSVYICGRLNIYDWLKPIGNINEKSFRRIWYSEERQNQAEQLSESDFCKKKCPQCRISKFNQLFSRLNSVKSIHFI